MDNNEPPISHIDLYHKLGRLEALIETMMSSISTFQVAIKDIHSRIDNLEARQTKLETKQSSSNGAAGALASVAKDVAIPLMAIAVTWFIAVNQVSSIKSTNHVPTRQHIGGQ
jgi:hypothetical protein